MPQPSHYPHAKIVLCVDDAAFLYIYREKTLKKEERSSSNLTLHDSASHSTLWSQATRSRFENWSSNVHSRSWKESERRRYSRYIYLNDHEFFGYCNKFKYLGTIFTPSLKDDADINKRIASAVGAFATMKKVLCNSKIPVKLRVWIFDATVVNILLWGCESWALTAELERKLKVCHNRFLRKMVGITIIYDVKDHHISMVLVREELGNCYEINQSMELRRARWL